MSNDREDNVVDLGAVELETELAHERLHLAQSEAIVLKKLAWAILGALGAIIAVLLLGLLLQ